MGRKLLRCNPPVWFILKHAKSCGRGGKGNLLVLSRVNLFAILWRVFQIDAWYYYLVSFTGPKLFAPDLHCHSKFDIGRDLIQINHCVYWRHTCIPGSKQSLRDKGKYFGAMPATLALYITLTLDVINTVYI